MSHPPESTIEDARFATAIAPFAADSPGVATLTEINQLHEATKTALSNPSATGNGVVIVFVGSGVDPAHETFEEQGTNVRHADVTPTDADTSAGAFTSYGDAQDFVGHETASAVHATRVAPEAKIVSLRVFDRSGRTDGATLQRAYEWLHSNLHVLRENDHRVIANFSLGSNSVVPTLDRLHDDLVSRGVRTVSASGNSGQLGGSPATADRALSVGACDVIGSIAEFSAWNPSYDSPDTVGVGVDVRLAQASGTRMGHDLPGPWIKASGTSFSAPYVSGLIARYLSKGVHYDATPEDVEAAFERGSVRNGDIPDDREGAGLVNYKRTIRPDRDDADSPQDGSDTPNDESPTDPPESDPAPTDPPQDGPVEVAEAEAKSWDFAGGDSAFIKADFLPEGPLRAEKYDDGSVRLIPIRE